MKDKTKKGLIIAGLAAVCVCSCTVEKHKAKQG